MYDSGLESVLPPIYPIYSKVFIISFFFLYFFLIAEAKTKVCNITEAEKEQHTYHTILFGRGERGRGSCANPRYLPHAIISYSRHNYQDLKTRDIAKQFNLMNESIACNSGTIFTSLTPSLAWRPFTSTEIN